MANLKRNIFLVLLLFFTSEAFPQQNSGSGQFVHISEVEEVPFSEDCKEKTSACTVAVLANHLVSHLIQVGPLTNGESGKKEISARVLIDTLGQINIASVRGIPQETTRKLMTRLKGVAAFEPGIHKQHKANVIVDLKVPLYLWESKNYSSESTLYEGADSHPVWRRCRNAKDTESCTRKAVNDWINKNVDLEVIKKAGTYSLTAAFVIDVDGEVKRIVVHGGGEEFATEILNTLRSLPRFESLKTLEEPVAVNFILPVEMHIP